MKSRFRKKENPVKIWYKRKKYNQNSNKNNEKYPKRKKPTKHKRFKLKV
jgi:hypothetical protein